MTVYEQPGLYGLEIWRCIARGKPLFDFGERRSAYFVELREFLVRLHGGSPTAKGRATAKLQQAVGFERLVLCGGGALDPALETILRAELLPFVFEIDRSGPYAGRRGALRIFDAMGWRRGIALDLGQRQLKVMTAGNAAILPRDMAQLPFGANALESSLGRARLRSFIAKGLSQTLEPGGEQGAPDGVVFALPVALSRSGIAEPATYPGLFGLVQPIFADLFACPCVVLNDAILAGVGFPPQTGRKTLVVTLGFGVGAALWAS